MGPPPARGPRRPEDPVVRRAPHPAGPPRATRGRPLVGDAPLRGPPSPGLKTTSYDENVIALAHAAERGATEAVFANTAGLLCEGTGSNVFYVLDGELVTPTLASGCLAGITRELVLEWYGGVERDEPVEVLNRADEIFLASTTRDVQPVHRCDDRRLEAPGPVTREVTAAWEKHAATEQDP